MQISDEMVEKALEAYHATDDFLVDKIRAALEAALAGHVVVPKAALAWLFGEAPDAEGKWFGDCEDDAKPIAGKYKRTYWWRSKFRAMIDAASPVSDTPVSGWRDIASAPEDQMVLAYDRVGGQYVFAFKNRDRWTEVGQGESHPPNGYLSHWQPLPAPPVSRGE
jgi:hypothetical protein